MNDELPPVENIDALIYCPGSINLKPILQLKEEDFINDFNINVLGAVKSVKSFLNTLKKGDNPSIVLFSTVAVSQGMPFHSSVSVAKAGIEGLTKSEMQQYIRYIADRRLLQLGLKPNYEVKDNPLNWLDDVLGVEHQNFFEGRATTYMKAGLRGDASKIKFSNVA